MTDVSKHLPALVVASWFAIGSVAWGHQMGESYIFLSASETHVSGRFEVTLDDLAKVMDVDADDDGELSRADLDAIGTDAAAYLQGRIVIRAGGQAYPVTMTDVDMRDLPMIGRYGLFSFDVPGLTQVPEEIEVSYVFLFDDVEPDHRGLLVIENNTRTGTTDNERVVSAIFSPGKERQTISFLRQPIWSAFGDFVKHGVWHIWIGFDHILFIIALLLPSVLEWKDGEWLPVADFKVALWNVVKVITLFTVVHSITLSLASLRIVQLPSSVVECVIALSIAATALNNIKPLYARKIWMIVFAFGLFHGFGFASVLAPLGLMTSNLAVALFGFNVGVELGQVAIIAVVFPVLFLLRRTKVYVPLILKVGSFGLIVMSAIWFFERAGHVWQRVQELGYI